MFCLSAHVGITANMLSQKQKQLTPRGVFRKVTTFVLKTSIYSKLREYKALSYKHSKAVVPTHRFLKAK